jgi:hypothetical protein
MKWLRRIRGAALIGLAWAAVWAPIGQLMGTIWNPASSMDEMWVAVGAGPGFLCGVVFCAVLGMAVGPCRLDELPIPRTGAWGVVSGLFVGALPFTLGTPSTDLPLWRLGAEIIGPVTLLSAASAVGSALLARMAIKRAWHAHNESAA